MNTQHTTTPPAAETDETSGTPRHIGRPRAMLGTALAVSFLCVAAAFGELSQQDNAYVLSAVQRGMALVKLGELAAQRGLREEVKAYGQLMAKERGRITDELKALAVQKKLALPDGQASEYLEQEMALSALQGARFDIGYVDTMRKELSEDLRAYTAAKADTLDVDLKYLIERSQAVLNEHMNLLKAVRLP